MYTTLKSGEEIIKEFFNDLDEILPNNNDKKLVAELRRLQNENKFTDSKLIQSLDSLRKTEVKK